MRGNAAVIPRAAFMSLAAASALAASNRLVAVVLGKIP